MYICSHRNLFRYTQGGVISLTDKVLIARCNREVSNCDHETGRKAKSLIDERYRTIVGLVLSRFNDKVI